MPTNTSLYSDFLPFQNSSYSSNKLNKLFVKGKELHNILSTILFFQAHNYHIKREKTHLSGKVKKKTKLHFAKYSYIFVLKAVIFL